MPKWPFKWASNPAGEAYYHIEETRKNRAIKLHLARSQLSAAPEAIGQLLPVVLVSGGLGNL